MSLRSLLIGEPAPTRPAAFVVGASRRVGKAIALALARVGCDVDFSYNHRQKEAEETRAEVRALGAKSEMWSMALDNLHTAGTVSDRIARGRPVWDVLVYSASRYERGTIDAVTSDQLLLDYQINAAACALIVQNFAPRLCESTRPGGGSIVTMCDIAAMGAIGPHRKNYVSYSMSKAALLELTQALALELAPKVRVNAVAPGAVAWPEKGPESAVALQQQYLARVPLGRAGTPEEAAEAVRWLALDATYCTGQVIRVDGGRAIT